MPRDRRGWHVDPAPDGRGMPEEHKPRPPHRLPVFWIVLFLLLAINWAGLLMSQSGGQPRVTVPFSPYFLAQVQAGQVKSISSTGNTIAGTFATKLQYPPGDKAATPTTLFSTEVPSFWDDAALTALLRSKGVQVNAHAPATGGSLAGELLLGFGPTLLLVAVFLLLARRAGAGGPAGALGAFGRSRARRVDSETIRVTLAGEISAQTQWVIDQEVERLVGSAHAQVTELLSDHRSELERLSQALLKAETLTAADAYAAAGVPMRPSGTSTREDLVPSPDTAGTPAASRSS